VAPLGKGQECRVPGRLRLRTVKKNLPGLKYKPTAYHVIPIHFRSQQRLWEPVRMQSGNHIFQNLELVCTKVISLCNLCVLCVLCISVVVLLEECATETQRTQRLHREEVESDS